MKILHFSTYDNIAGGAASAAYQLHTSFRHAGHSSKMIVRVKSGNDDDVQNVSLKKSRYIEKAKSRLKPLKIVKPGTIYNIDRVKDLDTRQFITQHPDAIDFICLHWITGLLTTKQIRKVFDYYKRPLLWTLMDQEPVTGGCHYSYDCDGFTRQCGNCPQLISPHPYDHSYVVWRRKFDYLQKIPIVFVAPSSWAVSKLRQSSLFCNHRVELIPLPINNTVFRPFDQKAARYLLRVPPDKKVIYFGARILNEERKGMKYFLEALKILVAKTRANSNGLKNEDVHLLIVGSDVDDYSWPYPNTNVSYLRDEVSLALTYQAADVFTCPSVEDAGPMMISEAMMCGTPVTAFNTGRSPDLIRTMETGYLANYKDSNDFANGLYSLLTSTNLSNIGAAAHKLATAEHSPSNVVERYLALYKSLSTDSLTQR